MVDLETKSDEYLFELCGDFVDICNKLLRDEASDAVEEARSARFK